MTREAELLIRCLSVQERLAKLQAAGSDEELQEGGVGATKLDARSPPRESLAALSHAFERLGLLSEVDAVALAATDGAGSGLSALPREVERAGVELERAVDWVERRPSSRASPGLVRRLREEGDVLGRVTRIALVLTEVVTPDSRRERACSESAASGFGRPHTPPAPKTVVAQLLIHRARRKPDHRAHLLGAAERLLDQEPCSDAAWRRARASLGEAERAQAAETSRAGSEARDVVGGRLSLGGGLYEALGLRAEPRDHEPRRARDVSLRWRHATTGSPEDARRFVLDDPRRILFDLATGRQRIRSWSPLPTGDARPPTGALWWCDASPSMGGPRAQLRDALLAEAHRDGALGAKTRPEITHEPPVLDGVDGTGPGVGRTGGGRSLVVVTDGEDDRVADWLRRHGARFDALCVVLLGEDSPTLRAAVERLGQRARVRFHHLDDLEIARWKIDPGVAPLLTAPELRPSEASKGRVLAALEAFVARGRRPEAEAAFEVLFPQTRTRRMTGARPTPGTPEGAEALSGEATHTDGARVAGMLEAVCEAIALAPGAVRAAEAVELLERLLGRYEISMRRYQAALRASPAASAIVETVRLLCAASGPVAASRALPTSLRPEVRP